MSMSNLPIMNDTQLQNQREALALIEEIMRGYEQEFIGALDDAEMLESVRAKLHRVYAIRYAIRAAIAAYLAQQRQSA